jgi:hypothetical protein
MRQNFNDKIFLEIADNPVKWLHVQEQHRPQLNHCKSVEHTYHWRTQWDIKTFFLSSLSWPLLPTHCRYRALLLHLITLNDTHTLGRTPLDKDPPDAENSTWKHTTLTRDRYPCPKAGFEPAIPASERPHTHALDRAATGIGWNTL